MRRGFLAVALVIACGGLWAPPALAGTAANASSREVSYKAWSGETNQASLTWDTRGVTVDDRGALLVLGCLPLGLNRVSCLAPGWFPLVGCDASCRATVTLGDGIDSGHVVNAPVSAALSVLLDGGTGNDRLIANVGTIDGGAGDDFLVGGSPGAPGSVHFVCGPGDDNVQARAGDSVDADCEHVSRSAAVRRAAPAAMKTGAAAAIRKAGRGRR